MKKSLFTNFLKNYLALTVLALLSLITISESSLAFDTVVQGGNIGLGTSNPDTALHVIGAVCAEASDTGCTPTPAAGDVRGKRLCIGTSCMDAWPTGGSSQWTTSGTSIYYNAGNVGIGTATPTSLFHLVNELTSQVITADTYNDTMQPTLMFRRARGSLATPLPVQTGDHLVRIQASGYDGTQMQTARAAIRMTASQNWNTAANGADIRFFTTANDTITLAEAMRITNDGRVGIGTGLPTEKLDVVGNVRATQFCLSGAGCIATWPTGGGSSQWTTSGTNIYYSSGNVGIGTATPGATLHATNSDIGGTTSVARFGGYGDFNVDAPGVVGGRFIVKNSGNVGIGTASPQYKLDVAGQIRATQGIDVGNAAGAYTYITMRDDESPNGVKYIHANSNVVGFLSGAGTWLAYWDDAGTMRNTAGIYATAFYYTSDERLKRDIVPVEKGLDIISGLKGSKFTWRESGEKSAGLIAQDVEKVFPVAVSTDDQTGMKSLNYGALIAPMVESIKELDKKNQEQDKKIILLEGEIENIKNELEQLKNTK